MLPSYDDLFYENIIKDFEDQCGYSEATEDDVNEYFTNWFYQVETEEELEILNQAESYIRKRIGLEG